MSKNRTIKRFYFIGLYEFKGKTDCPTFLRNCAESGIGKWIVPVREMTRAYYDQAGELVLTEKIPG
jgi:uncharacterized protein YbcV (DUF1398 family)